MKNGLLALLLVLTIGCKSDTKENVTASDKTQVEVKSQTNELNVVINFKTNKADNFKISLNNIVVDEFQKKNVQVIEKVSPTTATDIIKAKFGANNISKNITINFGNKVVKEVEIESIELSFGSNTKSIKASDLSKNFTMNKYISFDETTFRITTQRVEGKHNPTITLKKTILNKLIKE